MMDCSPSKKDGMCEFKKKSVPMDGAANKWKSLYEKENPRL